MTLIKHVVLKTGSKALRIQYRIGKKRYHRQFKDNEEGMAKALKVIEEYDEQKRIYNENIKTEFKLIKNGFNNSNDTRISGLYIFIMTDKRTNRKSVRMQASPMLNSKILFSNTKVVKSEDDVVEFIINYSWKLADKSIAKYESIPKKHFVEYKKRFNDLEKEVRVYNESISKRR